MSEDSKMGLFGSKDKSQEQRERSSKDNSPIRYVPYVDSDTEAYDTEALSMMDINDIIGVQSGEQVGDSTLESEIAALSQIITESKIESTQQSVNSKAKVHQVLSKTSSPISETVRATVNDIVSVLDIDEPSTVSEKYMGNIFEIQEEMTDCIHKDVIRKDLSSAKMDKSVPKNIELNSAKCDKTTDVNIKEPICGTTVIYTSESSSNNKPHMDLSTDTLANTSQEDIQDKQQINVIPLADLEKDAIGKIKHESIGDPIKNHDEMVESKNDIKPIVTVGSISKSLQLIGEAYLSEDSEETNMNDNDSLKETLSFSISGESSSFGISKIQHEKDNSGIIELSEQNIEISSKLSSDANKIVSEESNTKIKNVANKIEESNVKESESSRQCKRLKQTLESSALNKVAKYDKNEIPSSAHEETENNVKVHKADTTEESLLECQSLSEISEITNITVNAPIMSLKEITKNLEENQEIETRNTVLETNITTFISEAEKQSNSMIPSGNELLDARETDDNCFPINTKEIIKNRTELKNKDNSSDSTSNIQDSVLTEISDEKVNMTEAMSKSDELQKVNVVNSQTIQEIVSTANKVNGDSQEKVVTQMDFETTAISSNQDSPNLIASTENTIVLSDKNRSETASEVTNDVNLNEDIAILTHQIIKERDVTNVTSNIQFRDNQLSNEQNLTSGLLIQSNTSATTSADMNNFDDTSIHMKESIETFESIALVECDESVNSSEIDKSEVNEISSIIPNKSEDLYSAPISDKEAINAVEHINEPLLESEKIDSKTKIPETVSTSMSKIESETLSTEDISQQILGRFELHSQHEKISFCDIQMEDKSTLENVTSSDVVSENDTNPSLIDNLIVAENDVASSLHDTKHKEDKAEESITTEISLRETGINKMEILTSNPNERKIIGSEKHAEEENETLEMSLILDSKTSEPQTLNLQDGNSQDEEKCDETIRSYEEVLKESDDDSSVPIVEEKNLEPIEKSIDTDLKNAQPIDISIPILQENSKNITEEQNKSGATENYLQDNKSILDGTNNIVEMFSEMQSSKEERKVVTSMLSDDISTDVRSIREIERNVRDNEKTVLQDSVDLPLEANIEKLAEKLSASSVDMDDTMVTQNMDSLEKLLGLDLISTNENSSLKNRKIVDKVPEEEAASKDVDMDLLMAQTNQSETTLTQNSNYITNMITSCLANRDEETNEVVVSVSADERDIENETGGSLKINEDLSTKMTSDKNVDTKIERALGTSDLQKRNVDVDIDFESNRLESVADLEQTENKLELPQDILLESVPRENLTIDTPTVIENSQSSSEISELESAVKFLQESEEQTIDSPLMLSPKMVESVVEDITKQASAELYAVPDETDNYTNAESELASRISISISEAEIISEAAKLENERKFAVQIQNIPDTGTKDQEIGTEISGEIKVKNKETEDQTCSEVSSDTAPMGDSLHEEKEVIPGIRPLSSEGILKTCELIPRSSILEERLKEPPKIEIPVPDSVKALESTMTPNDSLLIPKDARAMAYSRMLESPKSIDRNINESRGSGDTPRKEPEKHDFENVGSPRIILKIVKSAIADCSEPRSPKSPKIRSAANSPNPEDSPGQKLGKIKLKLSRGGHPSIISNENLEETSGQWHTDSSTLSSLSPIGVKIKLSKSGDASIVGATIEKHDRENNPDDSKETARYKFVEEPKRTDSPIGMKIKLSKSGDSASIVQQDTKEVFAKHKDKLEVPQESPKRTESPIGMKIKLSKTGDASIIQTDRQENFSEEHKEPAAKRMDSPIGMKIKLSKTGDASIVSPSDPAAEELSAAKDPSSKTKEKQDYSAELPKRTESPIGMKIKLSKCKGSASIISVDAAEDTREKLEIPDLLKRTESPLGMKIKLSKSGDASIIHSEITDDHTKETRHKERSDITAQDTPTTRSTESAGIKIKVLKSGETTSTLLPSMIEEKDACHGSESSSSIGVKIKMSKSGDASMVTDKMEQTDDLRLREAQIETPKRNTESPIGMKIKLSRSGDASIVQSETMEDNQNKATRISDVEYAKCDALASPSSSLGMKIKLFRTGDASVVEAESSKKDKQQRRGKDAAETSLEMKIKLSKTGHPTIVTCDSHGSEGSSSHKGAKELPSTVVAPDTTLAGFSHRYAEHHTAHVTHSKESPPSLKILKSASSGHSSILQGARSELTIEPVTAVQIQNRKAVENALEISAKRKDITISPVENKKSKLEAQLSQILPEVTIQPVMCRDQKQQQQQQQQQQLLFDPKTSLISRQQMNVISQEISITQVRPIKTPDAMNDKLKDILCKNTTSSPGGSDCEIIEHRPELIIVNENSNSSQDVVIIEEVTPQNKMADIKVPKKRGRPRRNPLAQQLTQSAAQMMITRDPLALDEVQQVPQFEHRENERPKRTCRNQKSYAPPKRGRGRGRGKRKLGSTDVQVGKKPRIDQDLSAIEASTMAVITLDETPAQQESIRKSSELYKTLKQPIDHKSMSPVCKIEKHSTLTLSRKETGKKDPKVSESVIAMQLDSVRSSCIVQDDPSKPSTSQVGICTTSLDSKDGEQLKKPPIEMVSEKIQKTVAKQHAESKSRMSDGPRASEIKEMPIPPGHSNWLTPTSKKQADVIIRGSETVSTVQVIDEETRMSAESGSRSQTPARNIPAPASETIINEESQGSVLSTATTESEKVKVKNRRMEINFDPDEGPFTVDKIAEYEWPLDRKGETFMIQEQISQYLGVKSFKRKYPDLKRRMVDMEERNYLRENGLVSEAMCDMGLTAVCSSEVLDVMCSDFPDQYEEYRKHMREKQVKEHSKKQKELTAAANAERNRIDLAEMAVQSALSWNVSLNKARKENRKCCLDLQTFTIHVPKKQQKVDIEHKVSHYPVALIPGQYTDYYREYTSAELRYYPLNTVLYGPTRPNERKFDSQSEGSQSDSDSESSSDDSSSSSSEGTQDTEGSQSTMDDVDMEIANQKDDVKLKCKMCLKVLNKHNKNEILIQCGTCNGNVHPSCIDLTLDMVPHIQSYAWQCTDCKTCAQCHDPADEDKMLFCDMCDRGYHIYCVGLRRVPQGRWHCQECAVCANCGSREPGGANSDRNSVAQWQHEYKKGEKNTRVYVSTLCIPCSKLRGDQGNSG